MLWVFECETLLYTFIFYEFSDQKIFTFPIFKQDFCDLFIEELIHFEKSDMLKGRPNTMNNYGVRFYSLWNIKMPVVIMEVSVYSSGAYQHIVIRVWLTTSGN